MTKKISSFFITSFLFLVVFSYLFLSLASSASAANIYWIGPSGGNTSDSGNWSASSGGSTCTCTPGTSDIATFDVGDTNNAKIDAAFSVGGINITVGYTGTIDGSGFGITLGTGGYTQANGTLTLKYFDALNSDFNLSGGTITFANGGGSNVKSFTMSGGTFNFNNISGVQFTSNGNTSITNGTFNNSATFASEGDTSFTGGTFTHTGSLVLQPSNSTSNFNCGALTFTSLSFNANGKTINFQNNCSTGALSILNLNSVVNITSSYTLNVSGNISGETADFSSGTVNLNGTNQQISNSNTFYNLTKTVTSADTLTFTASKTQTITNTLTLQGQSSQLLSLRSSSSGSRWNINPQATRTISYLDVKDSNNTNASFIATSGNHITDSGNNRGWSFNNPAVAISSPADNGYATTSQPGFNFSLSDADQNSAGTGEQVQYEIQISTSKTDFSSPVVDYTSALAAQAALSFTVGQASGTGTYNNSHGSSGQTLSDNTYYWQIKAIDSSGQSSGYSSVRTLILDTSAPSVPGTPSTSSAIDSSTPTWTWTASTDSGSGLAVTAYTVQWSNDNFSSVFGSSTSSTNSFTHTIALAIGGTWYFRVKATDAAGNSSAYSASGSFDTASLSFNLSSPSNNEYTNNVRPTFRWQSPTTGLSNLSSYTLSIDNGDSGSFSISGISVSGTSDIVTSRYVIHYDGFADSDTTNDYISVYTKSSPDWSLTQNDGKLKEGKRTWSVTLYNGAGSYRNNSRTLYVDLTLPTLSGVSVTNSFGIRNGYVILTNPSPVVAGTVTDNLFPAKVEVSFYRENFFFGVLSSTTLISLMTNDLDNLTNQQTSKKFSYALPENLSFGKYEIKVVGIDQAGNRSLESIVKIQLLTAEEEEKLLGEEKNVTGPELSLDNLEKKARLRRYMEASELEKLLTWLKAQGAIVTNAGKTGYQFLARVTKDQQQFNYKEILSDQISKAQALTNNVVFSFLRPVTNTVGVVDQALIRSKDNIKKQIVTLNQASSRKLIEINKAGNLAINTATQRQVNFLVRLKEGAAVFSAYVFDNNPTKISNVTLEKVGKDFAIISWETNQPTKNNKLNYGTSTSYSHSVFSSDGGTYHKVTIQNLKPNTHYLFEVMSQGKNYTYDAYYGLNTQK